MRQIISLFFLVIISTFSPIVLSEEAAQPANYSIRITDPPNEQTFRNQQQVTVALDIIPGLQDGDAVVVLVDGKAVGEPVAATSITLPVLNRGSHTIQAKIIQPKGKGAVSQTITIFQHQAHR